MPAATKARVDLRLDQYTLNASLPKKWGPAVIPQRDADGKITEGSQAGRYMHVSFIDSTMQSAGVLIEGYPYRRIDTMGIGVPNIAVSIYPDTFTDDPPHEYQAMTGGQKKKIFEPLLSIYKQRGLGSIQLTQQDPYAPATYRGAWWGYTGYRSDRLAVRYIENKTGDLRGVAFFANEGQDWGFGPVYRVVLIQPEKHVVVSAYLPLNSLAEIAPFTEFPTDPTEEKIVARQLQGYAYLSDPKNYATTELGEFIRDVDGLVKSMQLIEQQ
jgi:hypothetical protein